MRRMSRKAKADYWMKQLTAWHASQLSLSGYCRLHGLPTTTMRYSTGLGRRAAPGRGDTDRVGPADYRPGADAARVDGATVPAACRGLRALPHRGRRRFRFRRPGQARADPGRVGVIRAGNVRVYLTLGARTCARPSTACRSWFRATSGAIPSPATCSPSATAAGRSSRSSTETAARQIVHIFLLMF